MALNHHHYTFIPCLDDYITSLHGRLECSRPAEDRNISNSVLHTGVMSMVMVHLCMMVIIMCDKMVHGIMNNIVVRTNPPEMIWR